MASRARQPPIRWVRRVVLGLLLIFVAALAGLYLFGRAVGPQREAAEAGGAPSERGDAVLSGEGFDYEFNQEGRTVLRIHGDRMVSDRANNVVLEGVSLTVFREDGERYLLRSRKGTYNLGSDESVLSGQVRIEGPDGAVLTTESLTVHRGQRIESTAPVAFRLGPGLAGRAGSLSATLKRKVYRLDGDVQVDSVGPGGPGSLRADRLLFERRDDLVRALGNVVVTRGGERLEARRLAGYLFPGSGRLRFLRAQWGVSARAPTLSAAGESGSVAASGGSLSAELDAATGALRRLEVEGEEGQSAQLESRLDTGLARRLTSPLIEATFIGGALRRLEAAGPARVAEFLAFDPSRVLAWGCGQRARASFGPHSGIADVVLTGRVELWQDGVHARGSEARSLQASGRSELTGKPAVVLTDRGELEAPGIVRRPDGEIAATGGVRARLAGAAAAALGARRGPVTVESKEASFKLLPQRTVLFRGDVRAWQGKDLLIADELEEHLGEERLNARGGVRTLWTRDPDPAAVAAGPGPAHPEGPVEITAEELVYDRPRSLLTYGGGVSVRQQARGLRCRTLEVELADDGEARQMTCREEVQVSDRATGRTVEGDLAVYEPGAGSVRVSGERVRLRDRDGTAIEGPVLIYDFTSGNARIEGATPPASAPRG